jgi:hypothetical protein
VERLGAACWHFTAAHARAKYGLAKAISRILISARVCWRVECINTRGETRNRPICVVKQPLCNVSVHTSKRRVQLQFCFKRERERQRVALLLRRLHLPLHKNVMSTLKILNGMKYTRGRRSRHINSGATYIVCFTRVYAGRWVGFAPLRCAASAFYINISAAPD